MSRKKKPAKGKLLTPVDLQWKLHTPRVLKELTDCNNIGPMARAVQILGSYLYCVGKRAAELNDPKLNALMCILTIYEEADPYSPNYDKKKVNAIMRKHPITPADLDLE